MPKFMRPEDYEMMNEVNNPKPRFMRPEDYEMMNEANNSKPKLMRPEDYEMKAEIERIESNAHTKINSNRFLSAQGLADDIKPGKDNDKSFEK